MKYLIFIAASIIISACSSTDGENSPLIGHWATEACEQATDSNGAPVDVWFKADYYFTSTGSVFFEPEQYTDSQCITKAQSQTTANPDPVASYIDKDEITLQEGIQGHGITLTFPVPANDIVTDGFYTINNGVLCFSGFFTFAPLTFGYAASAGTSAINFNDCLVKL